ncbi:hypothetical protein I4U23_004053 [Adineta vaga]|nr:hypothetical protein I4U23_004053 [Adineta vaga]
MNNIAIEPLVFNVKNLTCTRPLLWSQAATESRAARLYVCIIAAIIHSIFWLQLAFCSSIRLRSLQWIYAYLVTDLLLLFRFFFLYVIGTRSFECEPSQFSLLFICIIQATIDNYLNIIEIYIILALNVCRYVQIAYNKDVYRLYTKQLILAHLIVYLLPLFILAIQFPLGWAILVKSVDESCDVRYSSIYTQMMNVIFAFVLPIILNILVLYISARRVRLATTLQRIQHHVSAREKYNRSLVIQFLLFYTFWLMLWSPNVIIYQVTSTITEGTNIVRLINFTEIALDPFIIGALDVRFWQAWKNVWAHVKRSRLCNQHNQRQIQPTDGHVNTISLRTPRQQT